MVLGCLFTMYILSILFIIDYCFYSVHILYSFNSAVLYVYIHFHSLVLYSVFS